MSASFTAFPHTKERCLIHGGNSCLLQISLPHLKARTSSGLSVHVSRASTWPRSRGSAIFGKMPDPEDQSISLHVWLLHHACPCPWLCSWDCLYHLPHLTNGSLNAGSPCRDTDRAELHLLLHLSICSLTGSEDQTPEGLTHSPTQDLSPSWLCNDGDTGGNQLLTPSTHSFPPLVVSCLLMNSFLLQECSCCYFNLIPLNPK